MIFVFGTICIDRLRRVHHLPSAGGYVEIEDEQVLLGGEAANTANALVKWGAETALYGNSLGNDLDSHTLRKLVVQHELPYQELPTAKEHELRSAPVCDIYVTPDGDRTMFGRGFAQSGKGLDLSAIPFVGGEMFTAEPNMAAESREAARMALAAGMRTYLMDFVLDDDPVVEGSFWQSSTDWVGHRGNMQRNVAWVKEFVARKRCFTVLSDGPNGFVAGGPELPVRAYPPFPAPEIVDTTGAGDLFRAGMLYGIDNCWSMQDCLRFASAAGCLKCASMGATTQVPSVQEIRSHIQTNLDVARMYDLSR